jgi:NAD-dependent deacetylase
MRRGPSQRWHTKVTNPYLDEGHVPARYPSATAFHRSPVRSDGVNQHDLDSARQLIEESAKVVVLTGAGVSTASGIPDFRGPEGVWTKNPSAERLSDIDAFTSSSDIREQAWGRLLSRRGVDVEPNPAHFALVAFERTGKLTALVTQNIDGLHVKAGSDAELVIEVHGNSRTTRCL